MLNALKDSELYYNCDIYGKTTISIKLFKKKRDKFGCQSDIKLKYIV